VPVPLFHRELGSAAAGGPPIVILHGLLGSSRNWQTVGAGLSRAGRVAALDLRNHGLSPHASGMSYAEMAEDVVAWLDAQRIARATLLGHSLGGKVAMLLACRHPSRVERLIVVDIAPKDYHSATHRAEFAAMTDLDLASLASRAEAEHRMEARVPDWAMRKFLTTNLERIDGGWRWVVNLPVLTAALPEIERNPLVETDCYGGPTRFIVGGRSGYVRPADEAVILRHFPAAEIVRLAECGHNPHIEARIPFLAATGLDGPGLGRDSV
jgi:pimeloyl-ACP methyl ester carboxylesterase